MGTVYTLAREGVYRSIQGEGWLAGEPTVFVRLAGCPVGCRGCDTDYRVAERLDAGAVGERIDAVRGRAEWIWVTGGEPAAQELWPLLEACRLRGRVAIATSGHLPLGAGARLVDFLSVSPHGTPADLALRRGSQLNLVPGLNGLDLADWRDFDASGFGRRYVTPAWPPDAAGVAACREFVEARTDWRLGAQCHKVWGLA